jgi:hypothetical protein
MAEIVKHQHETCQKQVPSVSQCLKQGVLPKQHKNIKEVMEYLTRQESSPLNARRVTNSLIKQVRQVNNIK